GHAAALTALCATRPGWGVSAVVGRAPGVAAGPSAVVVAHLDDLLGATRAAVARLHAATDPVVPTGGQRLELVGPFPGGLLAGVDGQGAAVEVADVHPLDVRVEEHVRP